MYRMGRPRVHDHRTGEELLDAAERIVARSGPNALSVRSVAAECGVSTRAVYSVYGSKEAMMAALGNRTFVELADTIRGLPQVDDPLADVVAAAVDGFRHVMIQRPALFQIGFQNTGIRADVRATYQPAREDAFELLLSRLTRLKAAGLLPDHDVLEAAFQFDALCEGLVVTELRNLAQCAVNDDDEWRNRWTQALRSLVAGFAHAEGLADRKPNSPQHADPANH
jgi:AcrR family transcriptional regulator